MILTSTPKMAGKLQQLFAGQIRLRPSVSARCQENYQENKKLKFV
jgi:hypothetical protein